MYLQAANFDNSIANMFAALQKNALTSYEQGKVNCELKGILKGNCSGNREGHPGPDDIQFDSLVITAAPEIPARGTQEGASKVS